MWPQVPSDLSSLTAAALKALAREVKAIATAKLGTQLSAEDFAEVAEWMGGRDYLIALAEAKEAHDKSVFDAKKKLEDDKADDEPVVEAPPADAPTGGEVRSDNPPDATKDLVDAMVSAATVPVKTTFGQQSTPEANPAPKRRLPLDYLTAADGVKGKKVDEGFSSWLEFSTALLEKASTIRANSSEEFQVGRIKANYAPERILGEDVTFNLAKFEPDELTAALCAPATPYYDIHCMNTTRRPVFNSLPQFQAPRMKVSIMPSPTLSQITSGYGVWLDTDDDDANATKVCSTITCGSPTEYKMYGVWRCLTVKNMMAMSYPELVEAWLNRLAAAQARLAEQRLLNAMGTASTDIDAPRLGYGAAVTITTTILNYIALYQETQRWDISDNMEGWAHRSVLTGIKMDMARRRVNNGGFNVIPTDEQVNTMFRNAGVNMHWFLDVPTWAVALPAVGASVLNLLPQSVQVLLAPPGMFALMDRGELSIGVTGNNLYRDTTSNARNQFTFFFENFEGIVKATDCGAHILDIPVCWNGAQIDDIVINCQGGDEAGFQS